MALIFLYSMALYFLNGIFLLLIWITAFISPNRFLNEKFSLKTTVTFCRISPPTGRQLDQSWTNALFMYFPATESSGLVGRPGNGNVRGVRMKAMTNNAVTMLMTDNIIWGTVNRWQDGKWMLKKKQIENSILNKYPKDHRWNNIRWMAPSWQESWNRSHLSSCRFSSFLSSQARCKRIRSLDLVIFKQGAQEENLISFFYFKGGLIPIQYKYHGSLIRHCNFI